MNTEITTTDSSGLYYTVPRYLIYCWECNAVEVMADGRASAEFTEAHYTHRSEMVCIHPPMFTLEEKQ